MEIYMWRFRGCGGLDVKVYMWRFRCGCVDEED